MYKVHHHIFEEKYMISASFEQTVQPEIEFSISMLRLISSSHTVSFNNLLLRNFGDIDAFVFPPDGVFINC